MSIVLVIAPQLKLIPWLEQQIEYLQEGAATWGEWAIEAMTAGEEDKAERAGRNAGGDGLKAIYLEAALEYVYRYTDLLA